MAPSVADTIAAALATLTAEMTTPVEPFGYGRDVVSLHDMDPLCQDLDPFSVDGIKQALFHRFDTARGLLQDDRDYGLDLIGMLHRGSTPQDLRLMEAAIIVEGRKDDRVDDLEVSVSRPQPGELRFEMIVTPEDASLGTFPLVLAVRDGQSHVEALS